MAMRPPPRRKALLIGINYFGSGHQLQGCIDDVRNVQEFLVSRNYSTHPRDMVVLTDDSDPRGPYFPTGHNILAAMRWLVSEPGCLCFLHYSGHGGQVPDNGDGRSADGYDDTIVPVDFERNGQIPSGVLHRELVSRLADGCLLSILFDCCHSGSAVELPFVYRTDDDGNVSLMDNLKQGVELIGEARHLIRGDFAYDSEGEARHLLAGATSFFRSLKHQYEGDDEEGLQENNNYDDWAREGKSVFMFSGCKDEQTSADAFINGRHVGAMSWAFLETMKTDYYWNISYVQILQNTRGLLQENYSQIPQLSCGFQVDLNSPFRI
ncbi:hypothetical protein PV08_11516 [Exophiala spinifera]|uniref:Peptidase C14 caspase domain-containing protein n=1 Tax=Exophiala spinifera TaxID=91928 RepID=A0A0D1ZC35_9EURO|nr:uncharacterized protein PV08_11516 [Exophiala spinifera]KIW10552.1 hypothetical protein PV08_11516 [Exophiala spinifera]